MCIDPVGDRTLETVPIEDPIRAIFDPVDLGGSIDEQITVEFGPNGLYINVPWFGGPSMFNARDKTPVPGRDETGKVHGDLPGHVPGSWTKQDLEDAAGELAKSIERRVDESLQLGEDGPHRRQIELERGLLTQILKKLSGS